MLVEELIKRRDYLKQKIDELEDLFEKYDNNDLFSDIDKLLNKYQNYNILLKRSNFNTVIKVGNSDISVSEAVDIRKTIANKINILTDAINGPSSRPLNSVLFIINKRDAYIEEYIVLDKAIKESDWRIEID